MNGRFQIAVHIMTLLTVSEGEQLSSDYIAGSINANAALIRKELSNLRKHNLVSSKEGKAGGYTLAKPAQQITMAQIYQAVKQDSILGEARNAPNPACAVGKNINKHMAAINTGIDDLINKKLGMQSLADFSKQFQ
ncbi:Rrf2 family transcriptional regulator [Mucilaginibacter sp. Bleaf8]|uniref:RrF2 family transcriptional regulator n=1 Tax=Mucilaginibacter sp. Bleaf8 TaxID=2834430 RepID=UPI001BCD5826|nr:Rrf2 family transcriptional regulator [Mucilaginibacter sp. Bleaf8]MBS7563440.1 Rrf2 family transcriptional regulator [Mucilaginibacter sp. Bleaf8]